jgi:hypothetical protein
VREAVGVAAAVREAVAVGVAVAVPDADAEADGELVFLGPPLALTGGGNTLGVEVAAAEWFADGLLDLVDGDGDEDREGDGDGDGDREGDGEGEGEGEGDGVPEAGSAWHTASVLAVVARVAACALPSAPRVRKVPLSTVTAAARTCPKRIRIACLRCSSGLPCALRDSEATRGPDGYGYSFPLTGYLCITFPPDHRPA